MADTKDLIKKRAAAIKPGSSTFDYYMNTPLSELTDKTERLIKKELESMYFHTLSEDKNVTPSKMQALTEDAAAAEVEDDDDDEQKKGSWKDVAAGAAVGAAAGAGIAAVAYPDIVTHCKEWLDKVKEDFSAWWNNKPSSADDFKKKYYKDDKVDLDVLKTEKITQVSNDPNKPDIEIITTSSGSRYEVPKGTSSSLDKDAVAARGAHAVEADNDPALERSDVMPWYNTYITEPISSTFNSITGFFEDQLDKLFGEGTGKEYHGAVQWGIGIFAAVLVVLVVYAVWKLIKRFVKDDGDVKDENEAVDEALEPNVGFAVINEAETELASGANELTGLRAIMKRYADGLINKLLDDPKFIKYMGKENSALLSDLQDYQKANGTLAESMTDAQFYKQYETFYEAEDAELNDSAEESEGMISKIASTFGDATGAVTGKIKEIYNRIANHPNRLVRWIPPAVVAALTVLAIGHYWNRSIQPDTSAWKGAGDAALAKTKIKDAPLLATDDDIKAAAGFKESPSGDAWKYGAKKAFEGVGFKPEAAGANPETSELLKFKESTNYSLFMRSLKGMDMVTEALCKGKNCDPLELAGKGEKLADNIIERAKYVATDLMGDSDFVSFSKQQNPEMLKVVKKYAGASKGAKKVSKTATNKGKK